MSHADDVARRADAYWLEAAQSAPAERLWEFALDVLDYLASLVLRRVPGGNWEALYDTWLARATQHAIQAQALGRDG